jgi:hypothetical protein
MARQCFNEAWNYLDKKDRDANDEQQMLHLVHASRYHWSFVGDFMAARNYMKKARAQLVTLTLGDEDKRIFRSDQ